MNELLTSIRRQLQKHSSSGDILQMLFLNIIHVGIYLIERVKSLPLKETSKNVRRE
jgi:hypothetical protein